MHKDENPIAAGNYDDTFRNDPDREIHCPHCGKAKRYYEIAKTIVESLAALPELLDEIERLSAEGGTP